MSTTYIVQQHCTSVTYSSMLQPRYIFPGSINVLFLSNAYLCILCVCSVDKLLRLRENLQKEEQEFRAQLTSVCERKGLLSTPLHFQDAGKSSGKLPKLSKSCHAYFEMSPVDDTPSQEFFPASFLQEDSLGQRRILMDALWEFSL